MKASPDFAAVARMGSFYRFSHTTVRAVLSRWFQWRVLHPKRVPAVGPVILAANHASFADPPLLGCAVERSMSFLARDSLLRAPGFGWYLRQLNVVPVDRDAGGAGLKAIFDRLHAGGCILLFPEGTRSPDGQLQSAKSGIGLTVIKSDAPVVPIRLFGTFEAFGRGRWFPWPRPVTIKFGQPLLFSELRAEAKTCSKPRLKAIYQEVADEIMAAIGQLEPCEDVAHFP